MRCVVIQFEEGASDSQVANQIRYVAGCVEEGATEGMSGGDQPWSVEEVLA